MISNFCYKPSTINHQLILVGTNHKRSPIELRERISFSKKRLKDALVFLRQQTNFSGTVILSTCNRVEIYASGKDLNYGFLQIEDFFSIYHEIDKQRLAPYLYRYTNKEALKHLFSVSCGLDSQVLGETQILGQVKFFYTEAKGFGFTDGLIDSVFNKAIEVGRTVRLKTNVSCGNISIASIAVNLIKKEIGDILRKNILLIGVGEIQELVLKYLKKEDIKTILISNRTYEKAVRLAKSMGAKVVRFESLKEKLKDADVIISATSSPHTVIKKEDIFNTINARRITHEAQLLIIDLALPRDVEPEVKCIEGVKLFCLDDLDLISEKNLERRIQEIPKVKKIIEEEVDNLWSKLIELEPERVLSP